MARGGMKPATRQASTSKPSPAAKADQLPAAGPIKMAICTRRQHLKRRGTAPFPGAPQAAPQLAPSVTEPVDLRAASRAIGTTTDTADSALGSGWRASRYRPWLTAVVTWCDGAGGLTVRVPLSAGASAGPVLTAHLSGHQVMINGHAISPPLFLRDCYT